MLYGENDDRTIIPFPYFFKGGMSIFVRQSQVQDDQVRRMAYGLLQPFFCRSCLHDGIPVGLQGDLQQFADRSFVIYDQYSHNVGRAQEPVGFEKFSTGRLMTNRAPPESLFINSTVPLCASTNPFTIDNPRPEPPTRVFPAGEGGNRGNLSNTLPISPSREPGPSSSTTMTSPLSGHWALMRIRAFSGV